MKHYEPKAFTIPVLQGISANTIDEHLKLYVGYITHSNLVLDKIAELSTDAEEAMPVLSGLQKRFGFEYNGMRNHEVYFGSLEGGAHPLSETSDLRKAVSAEW